MFRCSSVGFQVEVIGILRQFRSELSVKHETFKLYYPHTKCITAHKKHLCVHNNPSVCSGPERGAQTTEQDGEWKPDLDKSGFPDKSFPPTSKKRRWKRCLRSPDKYRFYRSLLLCVLYHWSPLRCRPKSSISKEVSCSIRPSDWSMGMSLLQLSEAGRCLSVSPSRFPFQSAFFPFLFTAWSPSLC